MIGNQAGTTYNPGTLIYGQTYYWKVDPHNAYGYASDQAELPVWSFTVMDNPTISDFPWNEGFNVTAGSLPPNWTVTEGSAGATYHWTASTGASSHGPAAPQEGTTFAWLYCYLANTTYNPYSLITPPISLDATPKQISYYYWIGANTYAEPLFVDVSTDNQATWTTVYTHSNASNTNAWYQNTVSLADYASSTVHLRFRGVSNYGSGMTDFGLDNFTIDNVPDNPIFSYAPNQLLFNFTQELTESAAQNVTITNIGGGTLDLTTANFSLTGIAADDFSYDPTNLPAALGSGQSVQIPVKFTPQSTGIKIAALNINYASIDYEVSLGSFAYSGTAITEGFDGSFPPVGWANPGSWSQSTYTYYAGTGSAYKYGSSTTPYILSTPKLDISADSYLAFMGRISTATADLDIVYSTDRVNWELLSSITPSAANTWFPVVLELNSILPTKAEPSFYYLGLRTMASASYYIDNVVMPEAALEAPEAVTLNSPANGATNQGLSPTLSWTASATGGLPTSYDIYLEANEDTGANPSTLLANVPASPYTLTTPLEYGTTYIWKVVAKNAVGDAPDSEIRNFVTKIDPVLPLPYGQDFNATTTLPTNWTQSSSTWGVSASHGRTGNGIYKNIFSVGTSGAWFQTQPIGPITAATKLSFYYRWADYVYSGYPTTEYTPSADDNIKIYASTDEGATFTLYGEINSSNHTPTLNWTEKQVWLSGAKANNGDRVILKFEGNWATGDWYIDIDDIAVTDVPSTPTFAINPTEKAFGTVNLESTESQTFTISNSGQGTLNIQSVALTGETDHFALADFNSYPVALSAGATMQVAVEFTPLAEDNFSATLTVVDDLIAAKESHTVAITGTGFDPSISAFPFTESFDGSTFQPLGWLNIKTAGSSDGLWERALTGSYPSCLPHTGEAMAEFNCFGYLSGTEGILVTPPITFDSSNYELSFWMYRDDGYPTNLDLVNVYASGSPDLTGAALLGTVNRSMDLEPVVDTKGWYQYSFPIPPMMNKSTGYIILEGSSGFGNNIFVDDVTIDFAADAIVIDDDDQTPVPDGVTVTPGGSVPSDLLGEDSGLPAQIYTVTAEGIWDVTVYKPAAWNTDWYCWIMVGNQLFDGPNPIPASTTIYTFEDVNFDAKGTTTVVINDNQTLPVELSSFTATVSSDLFVTLKWVAESETDHAGYNVYRCEGEDLSSALRINPQIIDDGNANGTQISYVYSDFEAYNNMKYYYWLESVSLGGISQFFGPLNVVIGNLSQEPVAPAIQLSTALMNAFPNPFNPNTNLRYSLKEAGNVNIDVFNLKGQLIRSFNANHDSPGFYQVAWDGRDNNGQPVSSGIYMYRMTSGRYTSTKKMILAK